MRPAPSVQEGIGLCGQDFSLGFFFFRVGLALVSEAGSNAGPPGGPGRAKQGGSTQLTWVLGMGKLFETPQKAEAAQPLPPTAPHLLGAGLTGPWPEAALRCWEL